MTPTLSKDRSVCAGGGSGWRVAARVQLYYAADPIVGTLCPGIALMLMRIVNLECQVAGVKVDFVIDGLIADGVLSADVEQHSAYRTAEILKGALTREGMLEASEIAVFDPREWVWRHTWPASHQAPFERHWADEAYRARRALWDASMARLEKATAELKAQRDKA